MKTPICPTCGCSLVRLGMTENNVIRLKHRDTDYSFCCDGCVTLFKENPEARLRETDNLVVCPGCLAEKPITQTVTIQYNGEDLLFCRCPHCVTVFQEDPEYYMKRLSGEIKFSGIFSEGRGCCR